MSGGRVYICRIINVSSTLGAEKIYSLKLGFCRTGCLCENRFPNPAKNPKLPESFCSVKCPADQNQNCGNILILSVYETGTELEY